MKKEKIPDYLKAIPSATDDQLIWLLKVCTSQIKDKKDFKALEDAVQKERKKRNTITTISSKIVQPSLKSKDKDDSAATPDDY